jgi:choline-sulfatase
VALMQGRKDWRSSVVLEGWKLPGVGNQYVGLHTDQYVYVEPEGDRPELYDLKADPFQLQNVAADPAQAEVVKELRDTLTFAMQYGGRHCTR